MAKKDSLEPVPASIHSLSDGPPSGTSGAWNPDDVARIATDLERVSERVKTLEDDFPQFAQRLNKTEGEIAILDPQRAILPAEIVRGLTPAELYKSALNAGILAMMMTEPHLVQQTKFRPDRIDRILDLCDTVLERACVRAGASTEKK